MKMSSFRILKQASLTIVLGVTVCLAATTRPADARPAANTVATRTRARKAKARTAPHTAQVTRSTRKGATQTARTGTAKKGTSHRTMVATSARKPSGRVSHTAAASKASTGRKAGPRSKSHAPLTGRQRLARLHLEPNRVQDIQQALVHEGYLHEEPNGRWDDQTRAAMLRYQTEHSFSPTGLPDAKSLMKLGLGPHPLPAELDPTLARAGSPNAAGSDPVSHLGAPSASQQETTPEEK